MADNRDQRERLCQRLQQRGRDVDIDMCNRRFKSLELVLGID